MGQAYFKEKKLSRYTKDGKDYNSIGIELWLSYNTARKFCELFRKHGFNLISNSSYASSCLFQGNS